MTLDAISKDAVQWIAAAAEHKGGTRRVLQHLYADGDNLVGSNGYQLNIYAETATEPGLYRQDKGKMERRDMGYKYPDYTVIAPRSYSYEVSVSRADLEVAIRRALLMGRDTANYVTLRIDVERQVLHIGAHSDERGDIATAINANIDTSDPSFDMPFNGQYLLAAISLRAPKKMADIIHLRFVGSANPLVIVFDYDARAQSIIMPMGVSESARHDLHIDDAQVECAKDPKNRWLQKGKKYTSPRSGKRGVVKIAPHLLPGSLNLSTHHDGIKGGNVSKSFEPVDNASMIFNRAIADIFNRAIAEFGYIPIAQLDKNTLAIRIEKNPARRNLTSAFIHRHKLNGGILAVYYNGTYDRATVRETSIFTLEHIARRAARFMNVPYCGDLAARLPAPEPLPVNITQSAKFQNDIGSAVRVINSLDAARRVI